MIRPAIVAVIPISGADAANALLATAGHGPDAFSVFGYTDGQPSWVALHAWYDAALHDTLLAIPDVTCHLGTGDPVMRTRAALAAQGAIWPMEL